MAVKGLRVFFSAVRLEFDYGCLALTIQVGGISSRRLGARSCVSWAACEILFIFVDATADLIAFNRTTDNRFHKPAV